MTWGLCICLLLAVFPTQPSRAADLLTVAEKSDYTATARYEDVTAFIDELARESAIVRRGVLGRSVEGRDLPLVILADPPVASAEEAARSGKLVVFAFGDIHAGEVCGKEALLMLAREIARGRADPLLKRLIIVFAPIFNADGNERMAKDNRPGQNGPSAGMGQRANAQGLDLNRDYVKLESPEVRALVRFLNAWDPAVIIDTHTTNGSFHRYAITYAGPRNPAGDAALIAYVRGRMLPTLTRVLASRGGYASFFYGFFDREKTRWETYPALPRYGTPYRGLRNRIGILSEAYAYAPYRVRILATKAFVRSCLEYAASHGNEIQQVLKEADRRTIAAGARPDGKDLVGIRSEARAFEQPVSIEGWVEREDEDGHRSATKEPKRYAVQHVGRFAATKSVARPYGYLIPGDHPDVIDKLRQHGIRVARLKEAADLRVEAYRVERIERAERLFQKHRLVTVTAARHAETRRVPAGTAVVLTAQRLGTLAVYLLEPEADDGLTTWNFFDRGLAAGSEFPVLRLPTRQRLVLRPLE